MSWQFSRLLRVCFATLVSLVVLVACDTSSNRSGDADKEVAKPEVTQIRTNPIARSLIKLFPHRTNCVSSKLHRPDES